jgi:hypothetical protein
VSGIRKDEPAMLGPPDSVILLVGGGLLPSPVIRWSKPTAHFEGILLGRGQSRHRGGQDGSWTRPMVLQMFSNHSPASWTWRDPDELGSSFAEWWTRTASTAGSWIFTGFLSMLSLRSPTLQSPRKSSRLFSRCIISSGADPCRRIGPGLLQPE